VPYSGLSSLFTSLLDLDACGNHVPTIRAKLLQHLRSAFGDDVDAILVSFQVMLWVMLLSPGRLW
jgi:hypothetical protein